MRLDSERSPPGCPTRRARYISSIWIKGAVAAGICVALCSGGVAVAAGEIGGPPTIDTSDRCELLAEFLEQGEECGEPIVIGAANHFNGPVEIVAYQYGSGLCIDRDRRRSGSGLCKPSVLPATGSVDVTGGATANFGGKRYRFMEVTGSISPSVERVNVRYKRNGNWRRAETLVAQVEGELLDRLSQPAPFGTFLATLRGCKRGKQRYRLRAYDVQGNPLNEPRSLRFPNLCRGRGGTGFFFFTGIEEAEPAIHRAAGTASRIRATVRKSGGITAWAR